MEVDATCKTAAWSSKRPRHDDDDPYIDRPEGEKRLKTYFDTPAAQRISVVVAKLDETSFTQKYKGKQKVLEIADTEVEFEKDDIIAESDAEDESRHVHRERHVRLRAFDLV